MNPCVVCLFYVLSELPTFAASQVKHPDLPASYFALSPGSKVVLTSERICNGSRFDLLRRLEARRRGRLLKLLAEGG